MAAALFLSVLLIFNCIMFSFKKIFEYIRQLGSKLSLHQLGSKQSSALEVLIPEDLLVNILSRLPIKDLFRCKLVCKSWLTLITSSDPFFTSDYVRNTPFTLIFRATGDILDFNMMSFSLLEFAGKLGGGKYTDIPLLKIPKLPDQDSDSCLRFIGSYNCSVFFLHHKDLREQRVYMFNPVLGSCVNVAEDRNGKPEMWGYSVGFIPSNSTYKLVRFVSDRKNGEKVEIFTVGGLDIQNWRKVDDDIPLLFYGALNSSEGVICFNGSYHWFSSSSEFCDDDDDTIFTFDLLEEKNGTRIPKPHGVSRLSTKTRVTILNGLLSVADLTEEHSSVTMVIWSMREYGVVESWSKVVVLPLCDDWRQIWRYKYLVPIAVLSNGDILFVYENQRVMCFYNLEKKRLTHINEPPDQEALYMLYENTYVPSFYTFDS